MQASKGDNHQALGSILKDIYQNDVALEPNHLAKLHIVQVFLEEFKNFCLNNCPVFSRLFQYIYYTGSYFEDLRVCKATEFDINFVLSLSSLDLKYEVKELENPLPYATLQLQERLDISECVQLKSLFRDNYLIQKEVRGWFQSIAAKFCTAFENSSKSKELGICKIEKSENGPARTVKLCTLPNDYISIDLVPVFEIEVKQLRKCTFQNIPYISEEAQQNCFLVPRPIKREELRLRELSNKADKVWRINFPQAEKQIIAEKDTLKTIIKLMKVLRDYEMWKIPSYFLKVVAFWLVKKHPDPSYWDKSKFGDLFLEFLEAFENHLSIKELNHIIYPKFNLLQASAIPVEHIKKRVQNIHKRLESHPERARTFFATKTFVIAV